MVRLLGLHISFFNPSALFAKKQPLSPCISMSYELFSLHVPVNPNGSSFWGSHGWFLWVESLNILDIFKERVELCSSCPILVVKARSLPRGTLLALNPAGCECLSHPKGLPNSANSARPNSELAGPDTCLASLPFGPHRTRTGGRTELGAPSSGLVAGSSRFEAFPDATHRGCQSGLPRNGQGWFQDAEQRNQLKHSARQACYTSTLTSQVNPCHLEVCISGTMSETLFEGVTGAAVLWQSQTGRVWDCGTCFGPPIGATNTTQPAQSCGHGALGRPGGPLHPRRSRTGPSDARPGLRWIPLRRLGSDPWFSAALLAGSPLQHVARPKCKGNVHRVIYESKAARSTRGLTACLSKRSQNSKTWA